MIRKLLTGFENFKKQQKQIQADLKEIEWAHVYHDSIRGKDFIEKLPLNIGRWAGNYTFFYVLNRILSDYKPASILEFGLGESSKFVSTYLKYDLLRSEHLIVEHNGEWAEAFQQNFNLSDRSKIALCPLAENQVNGFVSKGYLNIQGVVKKNYDLYIVDGPFGSEKYSRYDIVELVKKFNKDDQFIIMFDDYQRKGEKETVKEIENVLDDLKIKYYSKAYKGNKHVMVLVTEKYKYITSL